MSEPLQTRLGRPAPREGEGVKTSPSGPRPPRALAKSPPSFRRPQMRVCDGCGRDYVPRSGKQRFCSLVCPGRGVPDRPRGYVPSLKGSRMPARVCDRPGCGRSFQPRVANHRFCSELCRELVRRPLERVQYARQKRSRAGWAPLVRSGQVRCARGAACRFSELVDGRRVGGLIHPGEVWQLGHPDGESVGGPEHLRCNTGAPSRLRATHRKGRDW